MKHEVDNSFLKKTVQATSFIASVMSSTPEVNAESIESIPSESKEFVIDVSAEKVFIEMSNGVLYLDSKGSPVAIIPAKSIQGINPGKGFSETGRVTEGYARAWKNAAKELASRSTKDIVTARYNWKEIQSALSNANENMNPTEIQSVIDIVYYFGNKEVRGSNSVTRIEYLQEHLTFDESVPKDIQTELLFLAKGIAGEESRFRDGLKSSVGASGIFQFMPQTVSGLGYQEYVIYDGKGANAHAVGLKPIPYIVQVDMLGKHLSNIYKEILGHVSLSDIDAVRQLFASEKDFNTYFLTPMIINAYNTGAGRMSYALTELLQSEKLLELQDKYDGHAGYDVFNALTEFAKNSNTGLLAGYKEASATYTSKVFGYAKSIAEGYNDHAKDSWDYTVASN